MKPNPSPQEPQAAIAPSALTRPVITRSIVGGVLMGLANLVPGVSGGTMLLAAGIYREFVDAIASVTRLRIGLRPLAILGAVAGSAALAILIGAGLLRDLVVHQRWIMFALFIGLTLGGIPLVWRPVVRKTFTFWAATAAGLGAMVMLSLAQQAGTGAGTGHSGFLLLAVAGAAGASAMILPGLSGGYVLLLLGQYLPILSGVDRLKVSLVERDTSAFFTSLTEVVLPVGLGVVIGIVVVSNLVQLFFQRYESATYGGLLGLLLGATVGLWPFQHSVDPIVGQTMIKGQLVTKELLSNIDPEDYPLEYFVPNGGQIAVVILMIALGLAITLGISRIGRESP